MGPTDRLEWLEDNQPQWAVQVDLLGNGSPKMLIGCDCCKETAGLTSLRAQVFALHCAVPCVSVCIHMHSYV